MASQLIMDLLKASIFIICLPILGHCDPIPEKTYQRGLPVFTHFCKETTQYFQNTQTNFQKINKNDAYMNIQTNFILNTNWKMEKGTLNLLVFPDNFVLNSE